MLKESCELLIYVYIVIDIGKYLECFKESLITELLFMVFALYISIIISSFR